MKNNERLLKFYTRLYIQDLLNWQAMSLEKKLLVWYFLFTFRVSSPSLIFISKIFLKKTIFSLRDSKFCRSLKTYQNWKEKNCAFNSDYFSSGLIFHLNFQFTRSYFWIWKICFHMLQHFFLFPYITILFLHRQIFIRLRH